MKITTLIESANALLMRDDYADYCEQFPVPLQRAVNQSNYDGISEVTVENFKDFIVFANTFWMHLPDNATIRQPVFFKICDFCEVCIYECEDYEEIYG